MAFSLLLPLKRALLGNVKLGELSELRFLFNYSFDVEPELANNHEAMISWRKKFMRSSVTLLVMYYAAMLAFTYFVAWPLHEGIRTFNVYARFLITSFFWIWAISVCIPIANWCGIFPRQTKDRIAWSLRFYRTLTVTIMVYFTFLLIEYFVVFRHSEILAIANFGVPGWIVGILAMVLFIVGHMIVPFSHTSRRKEQEEIYGALIWVGFFTPTFFHLFKSLDNSMNAYDYRFWLVMRGIIYMITLAAVLFLLFKVEKRGDDGTVNPR